MLKKIPSGIDELVGRNHCKQEETFIVQFIPFIFANDMARIEPYDDAIDNRGKFFTYEKCS